MNISIPKVRSILELVARVLRAIADALAPVATLVDDKESNDA